MYGKHCCSKSLIIKVFGMAPHPPSISHTLSGEYQHNSEHLLFAICSDSCMTIISGTQFPKPVHHLLLHVEHAQALLRRDLPTQLTFCFVFQEFSSSCMHTSSLLSLTLIAVFPSLYLISLIDIYFNCSCWDHAI